MCLLFPGASRTDPIFTRVNSGDRGFLRGLGLLWGHFRDSVSPHRHALAFPGACSSPIVCSPEDQLPGHDKASLACTFKTIFEIRFLFSVGDGQGGMEGRRQVLSFQAGPRDGTQVAGLAASDFTSRALVSETACVRSSSLQAYLEPSLQGQHHCCARVFWNRIMMALPSFLNPLLPFCQAVLGQGT